MDTTTLRKTLRARRTALSPHEQQSAREALAIRISEQPVFQQSQHIALYLASDGEIDPAGIVEMAWQQGKICYLPVLNKQQKGTLMFLPYTAETAMTNNRYGIPEPIADSTTARQAKDLDLVLLPLTGFDAACNRMGMGGGYYDRTFAFTQSSSTTNPLLIGLAHECQKVDQLNTSPWDVPMHAIATDEHYYQKTN